MNPRLLRRLLLTLAVLASVVLLTLATLSALVSTVAGSRWVVARAWALAGDETLDIRIERSEGTLLRGMRAQNLSLSFAGNAVSLANVEARWNPFSLLSGTFVLEQLHLRGLQLDWNSDPNAQSAPLTQNPLDALLPLPIALDLRSFTLEESTLRLDGSPLQIERIAFAARLDGNALSVTDLDLQATPLQLGGSLNADLEGAITLRSALDWHSTMPLIEGLPAPAGSLSLNGDINTLLISHQLHAPLRIDTQGSVILNLLRGSTDQRIALTHTLDNQSLAGLTQLPLSQPPTGLPKTPAGINALQIREAEISTNGGLNALQISGLAALIALDADGNQAISDLVLRWNAVLSGSTLQLDQLSASTASGSLSTTGELHWADGFGAALTYSLREQDASRYAALLPTGVLPGSLASTGSVTLSMRDEAIAGELVIDSLEGSLNDYPLSGRGAITFSGSEFSLNALQLRSGPNNLQIDGAWADTLDLRWTLEAPELAALSPLLEGSMQATGEIGGTVEAPQLSFSTQGRDLRVGDTLIGSVLGEARYENGANTVRLEASNIRAGGLTVSTFSLQGNGQPEAHRLTLALDSPDVRVSAALNGSLSGLVAGEALRWEGVLNSGSVNSELGLWRLAQPAPLAYSPPAFAVGAHCWEQADSTLCMDASAAPSGVLQANATLRGYALAHFNANPDVAAPRLLPTLPEGTVVTGRLNASVQANGIINANPEDLQLTLALSLDEGSVSLVPSATADGEADIQDSGTPTILRRFDLRNAYLNGQRQDNAWALESVLEFAQPVGSAGGGLLGTARSRLAIAPSGVLDGQVALQFDELQWIEAIVPALQQVQGSLSGLAIVTGTLATPHVGGNLTLLGGALNVPALGLQLQDLSANLLSDNSDRLAIQGEATSGSGTLRFFSEIENPLNESRQLRATLQGEDFTLAERPELRMAITPDLTVTANAQGVDIIGTLALPLLDVRITSLPESAVDVSADTVLVVQPTDGPDVHNAAEANLGPLDALPLTAQISVLLGEDVHFAGWGLDTDLSGALEITQRATGAPLTYGELTVTQGSYQTYGRTLNIEHGKLLFFGSYDNPALDIRATREAEDVKVGVQMNGTLRNIRSQLFSTPTLPDGDIIAVMLTGRPLAEMGAQDSNALVGAITTLGINQGQSLTNQVRNQLGLDTLAITSTGDVANSSLTLGKYLTPRIFIQYGIGLFETESTLAVNYTLSERVKLEAKSGSTQSLDITYTVER